MDEQLTIADPTSRGHFTNFSRNPLQSANIGRMASRGCRRIQNGATMQATGHATKKRSRTQTIEYSGFPAMIRWTAMKSLFFVSYFRILKIMRLCSSRHLISRSTHKHRAPETSGSSKADHAIATQTQSIFRSSPLIFSQKTSV